MRGKHFEVVLAVRDRTPVPARSKNSPKSSPPNSARASSHQSSNASTSGLQPRRRPWSCAAIGSALATLGHEIRPVLDQDDAALVGHLPGEHGPKLGAFESNSHGSDLQRGQEKASRRGREAAGGRLPSVLDGLRPDRRCTRMSASSVVDQPFQHLTQGVEEHLIDPFLSARRRGEVPPRRCLSRVRLSTVTRPGTSPRRRWKPMAGGVAMMLLGQSTTVKSRAGIHQHVRDAPETVGRQLLQLVGPTPATQGTAARRSAASPVRRTQDRTASPCRAGRRR